MINEYNFLKTYYGWHKYLHYTTGYNNSVTQPTKTILVLVLIIFTVQPG